MTTMSESWKSQRSSLKISLTTDDGESEVTTEGEGKGRFVSLTFLSYVLIWPNLQASFSRNYNFGLIIIDGALYEGL